MDPQQNNLPASGVSSDISSGSDISGLPQPVQQQAPQATAAAADSHTQTVPTVSESSALNQKFNPESPSVAEDVDLIEKEWVNKAKSIVAKTKNDPSQQNIQLNRFKADYLKTRFSKEIKPMDS